MAIVTIEYSWKPSETLEFDTMEQARDYVEAYYGDCDIEEDEDRITVVY